MPSMNKIIFNYTIKSNFLRFISFQYFPLVNFNSITLFNIRSRNTLFLNKNNFKKLNKKIFKNKTILWVEDFYVGGKDLYSKFSKVMIECSKSLRLENSNFKYLI